MLLLSRPVAAAAGLYISQQVCCRSAAAMYTGIYTYTSIYSRYIYTSIYLLLVLLACSSGAARDIAGIYIRRYIYIAGIYIPAISLAPAPGIYSYIEIYTRIYEYIPGAGGAARAQQRRC
jgi:hypothetical protein